MALWHEGVKTLASCCGHNKDSPNVVIIHDKYYTPEVVLNLLRKFNPSRKWKVMRWEQELKVYE